MAATRAAGAPKADPTHAQQLARLRVAVALSTLSTMAENLRDTARVFVDMPVEQLAEEAEKAVRAFTEAERLVGELMDRVSSNERRAA